MRLRLCRCSITISNEGTVVVSAVIVVMIVTMPRATGAFVRRNNRMLNARILVADVWRRRSCIYGFGHGSICWCYIVDVRMFKCIANCVREGKRKEHISARSGPKLAYDTCTIARLCSTYTECIYILSIIGTIIGKRTLSQSPLNIYTHTRTPKHYTHNTPFTIFIYM